MSCKSSNSAVVRSPPPPPRRPLPGDSGANPAVSARPPRLVPPPSAVASGRRGSRPCDGWRRRGIPACSPDRTRSPSIPSSPTSTPPRQPIPARRSPPGLAAAAPAMEIVVLAVLWGQPGIQPLPGRHAGLPPRSVLVAAGGPCLGRREAGKGLWPLCSVWVCCPCSRCRVGWGFGVHSWLDLVLACSSAAGPFPGGCHGGAGPSF